MVGMTQGFSPLYIAGMKEGLVQNRQNFLLPNDAYPVLENAFVWREQLKRKQGCSELGRLQRNLTSQSLGNSLASPWTLNVFLPLGLKGNITAITKANPGQVTSPSHGLSTNNKVVLTAVQGMTQVNNNTYTITVVDANNFTIGANTTSFSTYTSGGVWSIATQPNAELIPGSVRITIAAGPNIVFTDQGNGTLTSATGGNSGTINYITGTVVLTHTAGTGQATTENFNYYPALPVMGLRSQEINNTSIQNTIAFDTTYAYSYNSGWQEWISGTTWTGTDTNFFWSTNYWVDSSTPPAQPNKIFWVTNFSGNAGDPIRYTNGTAWVNFAPQIDASANLLTQCLALLPFRGRLVAFNTFEGTSLSNSINYPQRIRWCAIGTPFVTSGAITVPTNPNAWRDDIQGQGGFLDIPTNEDIVSVGFVRDNLVIFCERSTWQLRYTGRTIAPFQIEKVNSELGCEATFSAIQFDTSLVAIGDRGVVECDSFKSERIDIKIPDLVYEFNLSSSNGIRIHGIRDFQQRLAYWTYPYYPGAGFSNVYPNRRLVYNYENDSWAIFNDSFTCFGIYQPQTGETWTSTDDTWETADYPWVTVQPSFQAIVAGNQQGFISALGSNLTPSAVNDSTLTIQAITSNNSTPTVITSPNHNLEDGQVIQISNIPTGTGYASLNGGIFGVIVTGANNFQLWVYNEDSKDFTTPQLNASTTYVGGGVMAVRDNFTIQSKKFNFLEEGQNIQLGYIDVLLQSTENGAITLNVYQDYQEDSPANQYPNNIDPATQQPDDFFNTVVQTSAIDGNTATKNFQRVFCPVRGAFITVEWTLSNEQMVGNEQQNEVQIDSQILWIRRAGRLQTINI
jgi:hypothetical protein